MSNSTVGTVLDAGLAATSLVTSLRRWRLTSAATMDSASDQRSGVFTCWRGDAAGLGGWTFVTRISLATLQATGMAFFGLYGSTAALATTLAVSAVVSAIGIGLQRGTHTRWQLVTNDASVAPTLARRRGWAEEAGHGAQPGQRGAAGRRHQQLVGGGSNGLDSVSLGVVQLPVGGASSGGGWADQHRRAVSGYERESDPHLLSRRRVGYDPAHGDSRELPRSVTRRGVQDTSQERPLGFLRTDDRADEAQRKMPIPAFA
jgi:hypothetical protein